MNGINQLAQAGRGQETIGEFMRRGVFQLKSTVLRLLAVPGLALLLGIGSALAQSGDVRAQDQQGKAPPAAGSAPSAEAVKDGQRKASEFGEAAQAINGPAGNPECVWFGRRVVRLMYNDDIDTALRHLDLYDRFGCPGGHIQATFRCLSRFMPEIDSKVPGSLDSHVHACWINPAAQPQVAAATPPAAAPDRRQRRPGNAHPRRGNSGTACPAAAPAPAK